MPTTVQSPGNLIVTTSAISNTTTLAGLATIPAASLANGSRIYVTDVDDEYVLYTSGSYTPDGLTVIAASGGGYWISKLQGRWEDVLGDISQGTGPAALTYEAFRNTPHKMYFMVHNADDELNFRFQFPHRWRYDLAVIPHMHVLPMANPAGNEVFALTGYYAWSKSGGAAVPLLVSWTPFTVLTTVAPGDVYIQKFVTLATITPPAEARESTILMIYVKRFGTDPSDTYTTGKDHGSAAANLGLLSVDVHYRIGKQGTITSAPTA